MYLHSSLFLITFVFAGIVNALTTPFGVSRNILFVGDSQCWALGNGGFKKLLADRLSERLGAPAHVDYDCAAYRRFSSCYGQEQPNCAGADQVVSQWCARQPNPSNYTDVILMIGVNNLKNMIWKATPATVPLLPKNLTGPMSVIQDIGLMGDAALDCTGADLYFAGPLNVQDCGGPPSPHFMHNSCVDDITGGPGGLYWRSDWLQQQIANKVSALGSIATHINTSNIEDGSLYYDMFHSDSPVNAENTVVAIVNAFLSRLSLPQDAGDHNSASITSPNLRGTFDELDLSLDCEKDYLKQGKLYCFVKRQILAMRDGCASPYSSCTTSSDDEDDYTAKVLGVIFSAIVLFLVMLTWACLLQRKKTPRVLDLDQTMIGDSHLRSNL